MKLSKSNKDRLIGGVISVLILSLSLFIKNCYDEKKTKQDRVEAGNTSANISKDSSNQTNIQSQQNNSGSGTTTTQNIGTQNVNNFGGSNKSPSQTKSKPEVNIEENNGNVNTGDVEGDLTQTVNINTPTKLTEDRKAKLLRQTDSFFKSKGFDKSKPIAVIMPMDEQQEERDLLQDTKNTLRANGYKLISLAMHKAHDAPSLYKSEFNFKYDPEGNSLDVVLLELWFYEYRRGDF